MKVFDEGRTITVAIEDHRVVVIRRRESHENIDLVSRRRRREAIHKGVVGRIVRAQQELTLRATAGDEIELLF